MGESGGRKKVAETQKIIPGDRGKVESGWLIQPLLSESQDSERRQDSPVPLAAFAGGQ